MSLALKVMDIMQARSEFLELPPSRFAYPLVESCIKGDQIEMAWTFIGEMQRVGISIDCQTITQLFKSLRGPSQAKYLERAHFLMNELLTTSAIMMDEVLINILLDALINNQHLDKAVKLLRLVLQSGQAKADVISYNTLLKGCAQQRKDRLAFEIFELMKSKSVRPNDVTFNSIIDTCVRAGKMHKAWALLKEMQASGDVSPDNFTYSTLIKGIKPDSQTGNVGNYHDLENAFALLERLQKNSTVKPDEVLYNCLIDACVRFHDVSRAVRVFNRMQEAGIKPSAITHGILIKAYGQANQVSQAFTVFREMRKHNLSPNSVTYGCLIDACVKNGEIDMAVEVYENMRRDRQPVNTIIYTTLIKGFSKAYKMERALEVFEIMKETADCADFKSLPNNVTYNSLIDCCIRCGRLDKAHEIFEEMRSSA